MSIKALLIKDKNKNIYTHTTASQRLTINSVGCSLKRTSTDFRVVSVREERIYNKDVVAVVHYSARRLVTKLFLP